MIGRQIMLFLRSLSDNASVVVRRHGVIQIVLLSIGINLALVVGAETSPTDVRAYALHVLPLLNPTYCASHAR